MNLDKEILQNLILEVLREAAQDVSTIKGGTMSGGAFVSSGTEARKEVNPEVDNQEKNIIDQMNKFFIKLAAVPGIELGQHRMVLQRILNLMKKNFENELKATQQPQKEEK